MNNIVLFVVLPAVITFVLCQSYGYANYMGQQYSTGYNNYGSYGYSGYGYGAKGVAVNNVVYYPQPTPYYTPYADDQEIDPLLGLCKYILFI